MFSRIDRKRFEVAGLMPLQVDGKIAGIHKNLRSLKALAKTYGYNIAMSGTVLALHNALNVIPVAMLKTPVQQVPDDDHEIRQITSHDLGNYRDYTLSSLIENIIATTGFTPRIVTMSCVSRLIAGTCIYLGNNTIEPVEIKDTCLDGLFEGCETIKCIDMSEFATSNIDSASEMFRGCKGIKHINLSNFDVSKLQYAFGMFAGCENLETLDLSNWSTSSLQESQAIDMFRGCNSLKTVIINKMDNPVIVNELHKLRHVEIVEPA